MTERKEPINNTSLVWLWLLYFSLFHYFAQQFFRTLQFTFHDSVACSFFIPAFCMKTHAKNSSSFLAKHNQSSSVHRKIVKKNYMSVTTRDYQPYCRSDGNSDFPTDMYRGQGIYDKDVAMTTPNYRQVRFSSYLLFCKLICNPLNFTKNSE